MHNPKRHRKRELPSPCNNLAEKKSACSVSKLFCYSFEVENLDQGPSSNGLRLFLSFLGQTLVSPFSFRRSLWPDLTFLTGFLEPLKFRGSKKPLWSWILNRRIVNIGQLTELFDCTYSICGTPWSGHINLHSRKGCDMLWKLLATIVVDGKFCIWPK